MASRKPQLSEAKSRWQKHILFTASKFAFLWQEDFSMCLYFTRKLTWVYSCKSCFMTSKQEKISANPCGRKLFCLLCRGSCLMLTRTVFIFQILALQFNKIPMRFNSTFHDSFNWFFLWKFAIFSYLHSKRRFWVLIGTASFRWFLRISTNYVLRRNKNNI